MKTLTLILMCFLTSQGRAQSFFNDASLEKLLSESTHGLIFLWSPLMPLSIQARADVLAISEELEVEVLTLLDPHSPFGGSDSRMVSEKLVNLGFLNHYPALVLYKDRTLLPWMIQGYEDKENLLKLISEQLDLK